jgi:hypothetical protein
MQVSLKTTSISGVFSQPEVNLDLTDRGKALLGLTDETAKTNGAGQSKGQEKNAALQDALDDLKSAVDNLTKQTKEKLGKTNAASKLDPSARKTIKDINALRLELLQLMLEKLTGKKYKATPVEDESEKSGNFQAPSLSLGGSLGGSGNMVAGTLTQVETGYSSQIYERETTSYSAKGMVTTADGQTIALDVQLNMSREFSQSINYVDKTLKFEMDPLVVNFAGGAAQLTQEKFSFDLDSDGKTEDISFTGQGSGFLALDKNGDGKINNGTELFGPQSGSGFGELRELDGDGNGWIDESDAAYSQLKVWTKDENGKDILYTLKEADVGAIYLGDVETQFSITNTDSAGSDGTIRSTSFFLKDKGGAGTISHVDLAI